MNYSLNTRIAIPKTLNMSLNVNSGVKFTLYGRRSCSAIITDRLPVES